jgi:uncharacterized protein (DUF169 family)
MSLSGWDKDRWVEALSSLNLERSPIGVSLNVKKPHGLAKLVGKSGFCGMLRLAAEGGPFYADMDNHDCGGGLAVLGKSVPHAYESGEFGAGLQVFEHYRAMARVYDTLPRLNPERNINYVAFSPLTELTFEPDLLILVSDLSQAEIVLRAMSYSTGSDWTSRFTPVLGCAWLIVYPYLTGRLNYSIAGLGSGMARRKVAPTGSVLVSIPYDLFGTILQNLKTMPWVLPSNRPDGDEFRIKLVKELGLD